MERRDFLKCMGLGAMSALTYGASTPVRYPNIVFILADDMGFGDLACQNPESKIPTPNLDQLASQGMRFTDAHSSSAVCTPTRYSILTGRYAWRTELKSSVLWPWDRPLIQPNRLTVGDMLRQKGYTTACIGKWHLGWDWATTDGSAYTGKPGDYQSKEREAHGKKIDFTKPIANGPTTRGFDYYFGDDVPNFPPYCFIENDRTVGIPTQEKPEAMFGAKGAMLEGWDLSQVMPELTRKSVAYIQQQSTDKPFFLYMPLTAPHTPIAPTDEFIGKSEAGRYGDFVYEVDWCVGEIMKALEEQGLAENTLLIFTSDNGSPARDGENMHGVQKSVHHYGHFPSYIYRGIKTDIWEGGHRIPFIARWPGHIAPGSTSEELVSSLDFMATCAEIVAYDLPRDAAGDGISIVPALRGENRNTPLRDHLIHHSIKGMFAIRQGNWKYIDGKGGGGWGRPVTAKVPAGQLYNMKNDPEEQHNLYEKHPEIVTRLKALLEKVKETG